MGTTKKTVAAERVLPPELEVALLDALAPIAPARERAALLRDRLLEQVRHDRQRFVTVRATDGSWETIAPNIAIKMLDDDGAMQAFLLRFDPGAHLPAHDHPGDELCVVLGGSVRLGEIEVSAGDYHVALAGSRHGEIVSTTGALLFIRTQSRTLPHRPTR